MALLFGILFIILPGLVSIAIAVWYLVFVIKNHRKIREAVFSIINKE